MCATPLLREIEDTEYSMYSKIKTEYRVGIYLSRFNIYYRLLKTFALINFSVVDATWHNKYY